MFRSWTLKGAVYTVLAIGLLMWIVNHPNTAGHTAADMFHTVLGWGEAAISAAVTFVSSIH